MGWDGIYRGQGVETAAQKVALDFSGMEIVAQSRSGSTFYVAARHPNNPGEVYAAVVLTSTTRDEIQSKVMEEDMGPCECAASAAVLDALTPLPPGREWAAQWRVKAREALAAKTAARARGKRLRVGDRVAVVNCRAVPEVEVVTLRRGGSIRGRNVLDGRLYNVPARMLGEVVTR